MLTTFLFGDFPFKKSVYTPLITNICIRHTPMTNSTLIVLQTPRKVNIY